MCEKMEVRPYGRLIKQINEILACRANNGLQAQGLTFSQLHVLIALKHAEEETLSLKELEGIFHMAQSTIAGLAARLEKKGFVANVGAQEDRRVKRIRLTQSGREVLAKSRENAIATDKLITGALTEREQEELYRLLCLVYDAVK